ncbi:40s ribosomal protein s5-1 [Hordeum vulgare]|nr:40s ribosomal protein s5-1 [Hordeum vulgare]
METRLEAIEQQVFKCQGKVERRLNANHTMITEFTSNHKMDAINIGKHLSRLYDRVDQLQGQIYDLQNQNCEYEYKFKSIRELRGTEPQSGSSEEAVAEEYRPVVARGDLQLEHTHRFPPAGQRR